MAHRVLLTAVLVVVVANPALANWWIVRASDGKCIVVDIEPTGKDKDVTRVSIKRRIRPKSTSNVFAKNLNPQSLSENVRYGS
jgi:hypothetical protein